ncbi:MAG TPA: hypothetical protein VG650_01900 [Mycobacteriales bacterium]|nr:hypothetical protein [Mycobacteriales bacterium]
MRTARTSVLAISMAGAALVSAPAALASSSPAHLTGSGHGTWQVQPGNPDTGTQRAVRGHGHFSIGDAKIRGSVSSPGFIANGSCSVAITLKTGDGSIGIVGHTKRSASSYPTCVGSAYRFRFHTVKAGGALAGESWSGIGHFDLENASSSATDHGSFMLKLKQLP